MRTAISVVAVALVGCGVGGTTVGVMFAPPPGPISPGGRAETRVTVRFGDAGDSWAGRTVKVSVRSPADVKVEPAESEVALDAKGAAVVRVYVTPDKAAPAGPRTLAITATGSGTASTTLNADVTVR